MSSEAMRDSAHDSEENVASFGTRAALASGAGLAMVSAVYIAPFGALAGVVSAETGLSLLQALGLSLFVFAGASQLAAMELMRADAPWLVIVVSALAVNLRYLLYSGAVANVFRELPPKQKLVVAATTVDNTVSGLLSWRRFGQTTTREKFAFFVGCGVGSWAIWMTFTAVGYQLGPLMDSGALKMVAPVAFMSLAAPLLTTPPRWIAAIVACVVVLAARGHVYHMELILAALTGIGAALLMPAPRMAEPSEQTAQSGEAIGGDAAEDVCEPRGPNP